MRSSQQRDSVFVRGCSKLLTVLSDLAIGFQGPGTYQPGDRTDMSILGQSSVLPMTPMQRSIWGRQGGGKPVACGQLPDSCQEGWLGGWSGPHIFLEVPAGSRWKFFGKLAPPAKTSSPVPLDPGPHTENCTAHFSKSSTAIPPSAHDHLQPSRPFRTSTSPPPQISQDVQAHQEGRHFRQGT